MQKKIEVIDFLKGYSILLIVLYHIGQALKLPPLAVKMINFGGTGVHTFIFVSGFGLYLSHLKKPLPFPEFLRRRFSKIYIPYIIIVIISAIIDLFVPVYDHNTWYAFFGHVFLYKMFDRNIMGSYGYQLWFISTIIQFYFLFPLLVKAKEKIPNTLLFLLGLAISITWGILMVRLDKVPYRNWTGSFFLYLWEFLLGMILAERFVRKDYRFWDMKLIYLVLLSIGGVGLYSLLALKFGAYGGLLNDVPALIGYTALGIVIYRLGLKWINQFILFTANISYALYLIHFLILRVTIFELKANGLHFNWPIAALTLALCYLTAFWLDKFFTRINHVLFTNRKVHVVG